MKILGYIFLFYLGIGLLVGLYGIYDWNRQNKRQGFRLETYKDIIIISIIGGLIRPILLFTK